MSARLRRPPVFSSPRPRIRNVAEVDPLAEPRQRGRRHDRRLELRLLPFVVLRELAEQHVGDDEAEHRVAEELHRLVVEDAAAGVLVHARAVRQRVLEQAAVAEAVADASARAARARRRTGSTRAAPTLLAMALDDAARAARRPRRATVTPQLVERQRKRRARACPTRRSPAMPCASSRPLHDVRFDRRRGAED